MVKILSLEITNHCNLLCDWCGRCRMKRGKKNIDLDLVMRVADRFHKDGTTGVFLNAFGEVFEHPHWLEVIKILNLNGVRVGFFTNGWGLSDDNIKLLNNCELLEVFITANNSQITKVERALDTVSFKVIPVYLEVPGKMSCKVSKDRYLELIDKYHLEPHYLKYEPPIFDRRVVNCCYLNDGKCFLRESNSVIMLSDGRIVTCWRDYDGVTSVGGFEDLDTFTYSDKECPYT